MTRMSIFSLLFVYGLSIEDSTRESPLFLPYSWNQRIPTSTVLSQKQSVYNIDPNDYKMKFACSISEAWKLAKENIVKAQDLQTRNYDSKRTTVDLKAGERVIVLMPSETQGQEESWHAHYTGYLL